MDKKYLIPVVIGVVLMAGVVFTVVYKKVDGDVGKPPVEVETVAPKETQPIESKVSTEKGSLEDFDVNEEKSLDELLGGNGYIYNPDFEEVLNNKESDKEDTKVEETLSEEEINRIVQEQLELQQARYYDLDKETEVLSEEEMESIEALTEKDLSKYEMDMSILEDPEKLKEILHNMGY